MVAPISLGRVRNVISQAGFNLVKRIDVRNHKSENIILNRSFVLLRFLSCFFFFFSSHFSSLLYFILLPSFMYSVYYIFSFRSSLNPSSCVPNGSTARKILMVAFENSTTAQKVC